MGRPIAGILRDFAQAQMEDPYVESAQQLIHALYRLDRSHPLTPSEVATVQTQIDELHRKFEGAAGYPIKRIILILHKNGFLEITSAKHGNHGDGHHAQDL